MFILIQGADSIQEFVEIENIIQQCTAMGLHDCPVRHEH
jgi:hypothetical protein